MTITDVSNILRNNSNDRYISCIFLDLFKAFDTVNHKILREKLDNHGIRGNMHKLLQSYLSDRVQYTECNHTESTRSKIVCGVPQGSTLGPLLFSLYINDLHQQTTFHTNLFADDTVLIMKDKNVNNLRKMVNEELQLIDNWMKFNRLSLNCTKSAFFLTC